jgi:hypothetical protein
LLFPTISLLLPSPPPRLIFTSSSSSNCDLDPYFVVKACPKPYWSYPFCADPDKEAAARGKKKKGAEAKFVQIYRCTLKNYFFLQTLLVLPFSLKNYMNGISKN